LVATARKIGGTPEENKDRKQPWKCFRKYCSPVLWHMPKEVDRCATWTICSTV